MAAKHFRAGRHAGRVARAAAALSIGGATALGVGSAVASAAPDHSSHSASDARRSTKAAPERPNRTKPKMLDTNASAGTRDRQEPRRQQRPAPSAAVPPAKAKTTQKAATTAPAAAATRQTPRTERLARHGIANSDPADTGTRPAPAATTRREVRAVAAIRPTAAARQQVGSVANATAAAEPIAVAPGIVVSPELAGHYTQTGPPSFFDQVLTFGLGIMHQISRVIGFELSVMFSKLISSADPPFFTTLGLNATKTTYTSTTEDGVTQSWKVWEISNPHPSDDVVIAVHGGGFTIQPNMMQWMDYGDMARSTGATVVVPMYPLSQDGGQAAVVVPTLADFIAGQVADHGAEHVSIYADSAGGDAAVLAVQKIVRDCGGDATCLAQFRPGRMVLLSPALSGLDSFTDPNVVLVDDPVESLPADPEASRYLWQGDLPYTGPGAMLWDPTQGSAADLPPTTIYVGTRDMLAPGEMTFATRMVQEGSPVHVVIGMGQIHDWALGGIPTNSQAPNYRHAIYRQLGLIP